MTIAYKHCSPVSAHFDPPIPSEGVSKTHIFPTPFEGVECLGHRIQGLQLHFRLRPHLRKVRNLPAISSHLPKVDKPVENVKPNHNSPEGVP